MTFFRAAGLVIAVLMIPAFVEANGRFPEANQLLVDPADRRHLVARTTFGVLRSFDAGVSWSWICEEAISPTGLLDEELLISTEGRTSVALTDGVAISDRDGCVWTRVAGDVAGQTVADMVGDVTNRAVAYAGVNVTIAGKSHGRIAKTTDGGASWAYIGEVLEDTVPLTIDIAPGNPNRLYLGVNDGIFEFGYIDVSDDGGMTWTRHPPPNGVDSVYVTAVDPLDANRVYVRATFPEHTLFVSEDGALTWRALYTAGTKLTGFALSPDGRELAVGGDDGIVIIKREDGTGGTSTFTTTSVPPITARCLSWTAAGLYVCADEVIDGFTIGLSVNGGKTFKPLLSLAQLVPAWCPAATAVARTCPALWCPLASQVDASCAPQVDASHAPAKMPKSSGCGCVTALAPPSAASVALALAFLMVRRRQTARPISSSTVRTREARWRK